METQVSKLWGAYRANGLPAALACHPLLSCLLTSVTRAAHSFLGYFNPIRSGTSPRLCRICEGRTEEEGLLPGMSRVRGQNRVRLLQGH